MWRFKEITKKGKIQKLVETQELLASGQSPISIIIEYPIQQLTAFLYAIILWKFIMSHYFCKKKKNKKIKKKKKEKKGCKRSHYVRGFRVKRNLAKRSCLYCILLPEFHKLFS
jgi:hypothetical protein